MAVSADKEAMQETFGEVMNQLRFQQGSPD
jgi:hypothetical protein